MKKSELRKIIRALIKEQFERRPSRQTKPSTSPVRVRGLEGFYNTFGQNAVDTIIAQKNTSPIKTKINPEEAYYRFSVAFNNAVADAANNSLVTEQDADTLADLESQGLVNVTPVGFQFITDVLLGWHYNLPKALQVPAWYLVVGYIGEWTDGDGNITGIGPEGFITNFFNQVKLFFQRLFGVNVNTSEYIPIFIDYIEIGGGCDTCFDELTPLSPAPGLDSDEEYEEYDDGEGFDWDPNDEDVSAGVSVGDMVSSWDYVFDEDGIPIPPYNETTGEPNCYHYPDLPECNNPT